MHGIISPVQSALQKMTTVAEHINAMKKRYDAAVHVQEIQSLIRGWEVSPTSLTTYYIIHVMYIIVNHSVGVQLCKEHI